MNKLLKVVSIIIVMLFLFTACTPQTPEVEETKDEPTAEVEEPEIELTEEVEEPKEPLKVALIAPSTINDYAFTQSMYDALVVLEKEMGADALEFVYSENMFVVDDAAAAIRDYASKGYDLVIAHGSQYGSSLQEIAPDFPETSFAWGTTVNTYGLDNIYAYESATHEGGYVNGVMAALLTESKVVGVIGPIETGDGKLNTDGFVAGVKATDPEVETIVTYTGSYSDVGLAAEAATTQIAAGADALTGSSQMVVGAIGKAEEAGVLWFGSDANQAELAPNTVVACQVYHWEVILRDMFEQIEQGILGGQSFEINLENGGEVMEFNPDFDLPEEVRAVADETIQGIIDGTITIELP